MKKIDVAGLKLDSITKRELLDVLSNRLKNGQKTFITTPYSEFLYRGLLDPELMDVFNQADFSVPDGIGLFWAKKYLSIPLTAQSNYGKIFQAVWQIKYSLAAILFRPSYIRSAFAEKIPGSDLIWDIAQLAAENNWTIYLLGGFGNTPQLAAEKIQHYTDHTLLVLGREPREYAPIIAGYSAKNPDDPTVIDDIKKSNADMVLVAYGPGKQEQWIVTHKDELPGKLFIGLGGTFDYLAGKQIPPPAAIRFIGLEWLWRLFTQPRRWRRIWQATAGLALQLMKYKFFTSYPYRKNVVNVIVNTDNKIFIARRNPEKHKDLGLYSDPVYWLLPQGGVDGQEDLIAAARRETMEETGLKNLDLLFTAQDVYAYDWNFSQRPIKSNLHFPFRGQSQSLVGFRYNGSDSEIYLDKYELLEYRWVDPTEAVSLVHKEKKIITALAIEHLKNLA